MATNERPRVGVGVIVLRDGLVLVGERIGSHGAHTWALPGGHLEFGESVAACAVRELAEETGLALDPAALVPGPYTSDLFEAEQRHYVTLFVVATVPAGAEAQRLEPAKCAQWRWCRWDALPDPLFAPLGTLRASGWRPPEVPGGGR